jgi:hypothetical protein
MEAIKAREREEDKCDDKHSSTNDINGGSAAKQTNILNQPL